MNIVVVSDTHGGHASLGTLAGDVLIHCGDIAMAGSSNVGEVARLDDWFAMQQFRLILCTGGNHDFELEEASKAETRSSRTPSASKTGQWSSKASSSTVRHGFRN
jgi:predicted phosphodiesterase